MSHWPAPKNHRLHSPLPTHPLPSNWGGKDTLNTNWPQLYTLDSLALAADRTYTSRVECRHLNSRVGECSCVYKCDYTTFVRVRQSIKHTMEIKRLDVVKGTNNSLNTTHWVVLHILWVLVKLTVTIWDTNHFHSVTRDQHWLWHNQFFRHCFGTSVTSRTMTDKRVETIAKRASV